MSVSSSTAVFSADINISTQGESDYLFGLVDAGNDWVSHIIFRSVGDVIVLLGNGTSGEAVYDFTGDLWLANTWYNVRFEISNSDIKVFINNLEISTGPPIIPGASITQARFTHDNFDSFAYVDNFRTNAEVLSTVELENTDAFSQRFVSSTQELVLESSKTNMNKVVIYNLLGQEVLSKNLASTSERLNLQSFANGIYLAQVSLDGKIESFKFSKH